MMMMMMMMMMNGGGGDIDNEVDFHDYVDFADIQLAVNFDGDVSDVFRKPRLFRRFS